MPAFRHLSLSNDPHFAEPVVPLCSQLVAINCRSFCHLVGPAKVSCSFSIGFIVRALWTVTCLELCVRRRVFGRLSRAIHVRLDRAGPCRRSNANPKPPIQGDTEC